MTNPTDQQPASLVLSSEQLQVDRRWVAAERVHIRRRIVSETVSVPVTVRREELLIDRVPLPGASTPGAQERPSPLVLVLSEEVPVVTVEARPYERVTVSVVRVAGEQTLQARLDSEHIELHTDVAR
jgi:uncharacterized protein (TIGR02271 family)